MTGLYKWTERRIRIKNNKILENNFEVDLDIQLVITMAVLSKAWFCGCSFVGIACSNPAEGIDMCLL
jgi:hypothetical protein